MELEIMFEGGRCNDGMGAREEAAETKALPLVAAKRGGEMRGIGIWPMRGWCFSPSGRHRTAGEGRFFWWGRGVVRGLAVRVDITARRFEKFGAATDRENRGMIPHDESRVATLDAAAYLLGSLDRHDATGLSQVAVEVDQGRGHDEIVRTDEPRR